MKHGECMSKPKRGFVKLLWELREHLHELTGSELKVWLCHRLHEDQEGTSYPSLDLIAKETGMHFNTASAAHTSLRAKGWIKTVGHRDSAKGTFAVPVMRCTMPWLLENAVAAHTKPVNGKATAHRKTVNGSAVNGKPKTKASKAPVAMSPELAWFLHQWRKVTQYNGDEDWIFPSYKMSGSIPMCAGIFVTDHLRPAALAAGIKIADGQRFGLHSLRSSMATWMVSIDKTDVKTAQGNMRHTGPEVMLSKYAQVVTDEMYDVQVRWFASCGLGVGQSLLAEKPLTVQVQ